MSTSSEALAAIRTRLEADDAGISIPLRWHGEPNGPLPDDPEPFGFVLFSNEGSGNGPIEFGGGRGRNRYRNNATVEAYVFVPAQSGLPAALDLAETIAARLRSFRDDTVSCFSADVIPIGAGSSIAPPGLDSDVSNFVAALAEVRVTFDQVG
ncbi:hypothetical protein XI02_22360 [Bradyrhizobium sp. CCBAU 21365]|uniref:hypothetical protein n=1 Tax=Bradyrhizobium sp. CCBAU 21365 TaxID=1325083 RepID=UPI00188C14A2|nr:hypothetical protein [Bradyrhizobium sp. CCBAU 21365]QOZ17450.1 hypothetical protein XI02_22360 [Bradyrhizobium sp. CCBAU 21365]